MERKRMPRPHAGVAVVLVLLMAGAVLNVAVAWGCALWSGPDGPPLTSSGFDVPDELLLERHSDGQVTLWKYSAVGWSCATVRVIWVARGQPLQIETQYWCRLSAGWPWRCLECRGEGNGVQVEGDWAWLGPPSWLRAARVGGVGFQRVDRPLPLRPLWPGFSLNTLVYALALWPLLGWPARVQRMIRRRRGQCTACGYPVGMSEVCTECGRAVVRRRMHSNS